MQNLAKPNYSYEKRQRELARKKKNEEKKLRRQDKGLNSEPEAEAQVNEEPE